MHINCLIDPEMLIIWVAPLLRRNDMINNLRMIFIENWKNSGYHHFKLPSFQETTKGKVAKAWLENMNVCFSLQNYFSNQKDRLDIYQLKESALLWWRNMEP
jgi:hypothetical protein